MATTIDNRNAEVTSNFHGERGVKFTVIGNEVINEFHLQSFFDCTDEDSDEELLNAAIEWYSDSRLENRANDVIDLIEEKDAEVAKVMTEIYSSFCKNPEGNNYNTNIILKKDGTINMHNHFGSTSYQDDDIAYVWNISTSDKSNYLSMIRADLTDQEKEFCEKNNFVSIWENNSDNPADWQEFVPTWDEFIDEVREAIERVKENNNSY